ncbi:MAG TPA: protein arginine kinase [Atribacterota bacterium]|nr:protein arginine kinase [Atribacterota bacterium]
MNNKQNGAYINELRDSTATWVKGHGPLNNIVLSSRLRLARNIKDIPFPFKASDDQLKMVMNQSEEILRNNKIFNDFKIINLNNLTSMQITFLVEKRLISIALAEYNKPYRAFIYNPDEMISIMINEEDHYRIQAMLPGFQLKKVWALIDWYDNKIEEEVEYAFSDVEGFLTCCPTNVGTGLRASVMLHLPALIVSNQLQELMNSVSKKGYAVRGFYGEGTNFQGNLFQVSNQTTLGLSEMKIIENLEIVIKQLIEKEQKAREQLLVNSKQKIEDQVMRSYGILKNAKIISTTEAVNLLSNIRFGIEMGLLTEIGYDIINRLMLIIQPGYLQLIKEKKMDQMQRGLARAEIIQEQLNKFSNN